jgi:hypothetical protein
MGTESGEPPLRSSADLPGPGPSPVAEAIEVTVLLSREAYDTLAGIARTLGIDETTALHLAIFAAKYQLVSARSVRRRIRDLRDFRSEFQARESPVAHRRRRWWWPWMTLRP